MKPGNKLMMALRENWPAPGLLPEGWIAMVKNEEEHQAYGKP